MQTYMGAWTAIFQTRLIWPNSYYENALALKLFVGRVFAYFQIHMFSLTKSPDILEICWRPPTPHTTAKGRAHSGFFLHFSFIIDHAYVSEHTCLCNHVGGELTFICWWVKRATRVLNVLWPCKYLPVIHCWQTLCRGRRRPVES